MVAKKNLHERRGITFAELGALMGTRAMLISGLLKPTNSRWPVSHLHCFNMAVQGKQQDCGTVSCIGGTMALIMGKNPVDYVGASLDIGQASPAFRELFFPPQIRTTDEWEWITPAIAVKAIDKWLRTGKPGWKALRKAAK